MNMLKVVGPFTEIVTMRSLPQKGPIADRELEVIADGAIAVDAAGKIFAVAPFEELRKLENSYVEEITEPSIAFPGLIDCHTHLCFAGDRSAEYAERLQGKSYLEIAKNGGGIKETVRKTRKATNEELKKALLSRLDEQLKQGITSCEIKSGYGSTVEEELRQLQIIKEAGEIHPITVVSTCLAAHQLPDEYKNDKEYLAILLETLLPQVILKGLSNRVDIFIDEGAFSCETGLVYLKGAKRLGFSVCVHANQFSSGGALLAAKVGAQSADHLEVITTEEMDALKNGSVTAVVLPGASLGLGVPFAPARLLLDRGLCLAIASDYNPGSAPMGLLLVQAAVLGAAQKLTMAETWAALTCRAASALALNDRGILEKGHRADFIAFSATHWQQVLYRQGALTPSFIWIAGQAPNTPE